MVNRKKKVRSLIFQSQPSFFSHTHQSNISSSETIPQKRVYIYIYILINKKLENS